MASTEATAAATTAEEEKETPVAGPSTQPPLPPSEIPSSSSLNTPKPLIKNLILDAAPLLTLTPLRGLAEKYLIAPQVLAEIRDKRAREHFERLSLMEGVQVVVREPDAVSLAKVTAFAKQTGDYSVLSHVDLCVLALTYAVEVEENGHWRVRDELGKPPAAKQQQLSSAADIASITITETLNSSAAPAAAPQPNHFAPQDSTLLSSKSTWGSSSSSVPSSSNPPIASAATPEESEDFPSLSSPSLPSSATDDKPKTIISSPAPKATAASSSLPEDVLSPAPSVSYDEDLEEDDVEEDEEDDEDAGEWITPATLSSHRAKDLGLSLADDEDSGKKKSSKGKGQSSAILKSACMTSDYAVQNVLLQMGLNLVGEKGRRVRSVRSWVLRCHACFKICKDPSKKFCPSCGGATLLRTSVSTHATSSPSSTQPQLQIHLKKNYQYALRGTKYSIPAPKTGSAKGQNGGGSGLVLREDQVEFVRGERREKGVRERMEKKLAKNASTGGGGDWRDADWMPEMYSVGMSGKGRRGGGGMGGSPMDGNGGFLPTIGHGRKNPNAVRKKKG